MGGGAVADFRSHARRHPNATPEISNARQLALPTWHRRRQAMMPRANKRGGDGCGNPPLGAGHASDTGIPPPPRARLSGLSRPLPSVLGSARSGEPPFRSKAPTCRGSARRRQHLGGDPRGVRAAAHRPIAGARTGEKLVRHGRNSLGCSVARSRASPLRGLRRQLDRTHRLVVVDSYVVGLLRSATPDRVQISTWRVDPSSPPSLPLAGCLTLPARP